jgi:hypothetical protein
MGKVNTAGENDPAKMVVTPGGLRPQSNVHLIEPGYHLSGKDGVFKKIHTQSGTVIKEFGHINQPHTATRQQHREMLANQAAAAAPATTPRTNGWIIYSGWRNYTGQPITYFSTNWIVPPAPQTSNGQLIYLFNGIENASFTCILQPVLQWGVSPSGGGNYWAIANWYVGSPDSGMAFHGPLIPVNAGDNLQGIMTMTGTNGTTFNYNSSFNGYSADWAVTDVDELVWASQTLECYYFKQFTDYPGTDMTAMSAIEIKTTGGEASLQWDAFNAITDNGQHCNIVSNNSPGGEVDLFYTQPAVVPATT